MKVLVACECSGVVRNAFAARGHDAWSCDLKPAEDGSKHHLQCDVRTVLARWDWGLMIAHPECKRLANSGVLRLYINGKKRNGPDPSKWREMNEAAEFFLALWCAPIPKVCIENPIHHCYARAQIGVRQSMTLQPFEYGEPYSKRTCLWLRGLPLLKSSNILPKPKCGHWNNQTPSGQNRLGPSPTRAADRARTYPGIATAMAEQWGN